MDTTHRYRDVDRHLAGRLQAWSAVYFLGVRVVLRSRPLLVLLLIAIGLSMLAPSLAGFGFHGHEELLLSGAVGIPALAPLVLGPAAAITLHPDADRHPGLHPLLAAPVSSFCSTALLAMGLASSALLYSLLAHLATGLYLAQYVSLPLDHLTGLFLTTAVWTLPATTFALLLARLFSPTLSRALLLLTAFLAALAPLLPGSSASSTTHTETRVPLLEIMVPTRDHFFEGATAASTLASAGAALVLFAGLCLLAQAHHHRSRRHP